MGKRTLYCKDCKYCIKNDDPGGLTLCTYNSGWEITELENNCMYIPEEKEPVCGDCRWIREDTACWGCMPEDSALHRGKLCKDFCYKNEDAFYEVLSYWKSRGIFDKNRVCELIDEFEKAYDDLIAQV
ncbi:MAG: hypothetical protein K6G12_09790 [Lachnospiraceae bacterium]|nr:hypothetical protein [Lachnospiraceae bacterium]